MFINSSDGSRIAYDVSGSGPGLLLLHGGFVMDRQSWRDAGHVDRLSREFTTVTIDIRGHGESDRPTQPGGYAVDKILDDIHAVADANGLERFAIWGYSLGATVALQAASSSTRVTRAVIAGSFFGRIFGEEQVKRTVATLEPIAAATEAGKLDELTLPAPLLDFARKADLRSVIAFNQALASWPSVEPADLLCPALVYAGSANEITSTALRERREEIEAVNVQLHIFQGLDHAQELNDIETVLPVVLTFLRSVP